MTRILATLILIFCTNSANSQISNPLNRQIIRDQDWIIRQQQNQIAKEKRLKENKAIEKERKRQKKKKSQQQAKTPISSKVKKCFAIKKIELINADSLSNRQKNNLITGFIGECFGAKILGNIVADINSYYHNKGFILAQTSVPRQNIQTGTLKLKVLEGKINKLKLNKDSFFDKLQKFSAFGNLKGETLNIKDINQGIYQMNRLASNSATMKITPSKITGQGDVSIINQKTFPLHPTISYDNLGNEFTGIKRTIFGANLDNLLSLNDNINVNYTTNLNDDSAQKDIKAFSAQISIPFLYNTISYSYSRSEFAGKTIGIDGVFKSTGYSDRNNIDFERVLLSEGNLRVAMTGSLTQKEAASYANGVKYQVSERKLTIGDISFSISNYFKNGVNIYFKPSYARGLKILNATQDKSGIASDVPKAQFQLYKTYASISKSFAIPKINAPITLSVEMDGQISKDTLYGSEQFSVGGYYSVRGFRENFIAGDHGYYLRNKASFNLGKILAPAIKIKHFNKITIEPFYDYGYAKLKTSGQSGRLSGAGLKTIFSSKYFNASLTYSAAINKSNLIDSEKKENKMIYFEIGLRCC